MSASERSSQGSNMAQRDRYELEKQNGKRAPSGALRLQRLKPKHHRVIELHLRGASGAEVASATGMTQATISRILADPLAQEILSAASAARDREFEALYGMHLEALRDGFTSGDVRDKLRAASVYGRERIERAKSDAGASESAEDVIARILQLNIQVNTTGG